VVSDITESPNRPEDAKLGYGRLRVKNHTTVEITNIVFKKKIGIGAAAAYDDSKSFVVQKVSAGSEWQYSSVISDKVEEGNYTVFCALGDGSVVFNNKDFFILQDDVAYQAGDNVINIYQADISPPPSTIMYTVVADGGPPALTNAPGYTTTKLTLTFSAPVPSITFLPVSMSSGTGSITTTDNLIYEVAITNPVDETATFTVTGTNVDTSVHQVHIYKENITPPSFIPVTDVVVTNEESFTKNGAIKTIDWKVLPAGATNKDVLWTLGEADGNLIFANFFGTTPPYGLGADGKQHTDELNMGRLTVRSSWTRDYLYLAVIVKNGKAEGARSPTLDNEVNQAIVDKDGNTWSVTIQALYFDPNKDFVKVFRFTVSP
jgi:hypothetical protein